MLPLRESAFSVVLTACIDPSRAKHGRTLRLAISDPKVRLEHYGVALQSWLRHDDKRIRNLIFIDNSGFDLTELEAKLRRSTTMSRPVEFIQTNSNSVPTGLHYGYGEFALLDQGLKISDTYKSNDFEVLKATGRYRFPRVSNLLDAIPPLVEFSIDSRNRTWKMGRHAGASLTSLFVCRRSFFDQEIRQLYLKMNAENPRTQFIEDVIYDRFFDALDDRVQLRWSVNCDPHGRDASGNREYHSYRRRATASVRSVLRRTAPNFWV